MSVPPLFHKGKDLPVLWENKHFLVIDKPAGLASHPGPRTEDSVETRLTVQKRGGPWLVHRLDRDTSGCLLIARRKMALISAQQAFQNHQVHKTYWAITKGQMPGPRGEITAPLKRVKTRQGWIVQTTSRTDPEAQQARTLWRLLGKTDSLNWVELQLLTGRTHQARVHLAFIGSPILGDPYYGISPDDQKNSSFHLPLQLLSRSLELSLSSEESLISATASAPPIMADLLKTFPSSEIFAKIRQQGP